MAATRALLLLSAVLVTSVAAPAQATWIYDSGGGGNFTNLQVAVDSVAPGDTILLRLSSYLSLHVRQSVHLVGDAPNIVLLTAWFEGLVGPPIACTLSNVDNSQLFALNAHVSAENVIGADLALDNSVAVFTNCSWNGARVVSGGATLTNGSRAAFDGCYLSGHVWTSIRTLVCTDIPGGPALLLSSGSAAQLTNCTIDGPGTGSACAGLHYGYPAVQVDAGCSVDLARCTLTAIGLGMPSIANAGVVRVDATNATPPFAGVTPAMLPSTRGAGAQPGGVMQASVEGQPGLPAVIVTSLGLRPPVAAPEGQVWVDFSAFVVLRIGFLDAAGRMGTVVYVPAGVQRGLSLTLQGAVGLPANPVLVAAAPTVLHVL